jgi:drug/metabolite transporter superfamily protein YnfA
VANFLRTVGIFVVAALCELSGTYLIWQWQRIGKPAGCWRLERWL